MVGFRFRLLYPQQDWMGSRAGMDAVKNKKTLTSTLSRIAIWRSFGGKIVNLSSEL
jgi:hypothetical protein